MIYNMCMSSFRIIVQDEKIKLSYRVLTYQTISPKNVPGTIVHGVWEAPNQINFKVASLRVKWTFLGSGDSPLKCQISSIDNRFIKRQYCYKMVQSTGFGVRKTQVWIVALSFALVLLWSPHLLSTFSLKIYFMYNSLSELSSNICQKEAFS